MSTTPELLDWYETTKPRPLALTSCPRDGKRIAVVVAHGDRLLLWDAGYRMTPAESRAEEKALQIGVVRDAEDRDLTEQENAELDDWHGRILAPARVRPLLPVASVTTCPRCRRPYELDTQALIEAAATLISEQRAKPSSVEVVRECSMRQLAEEGMRRRASVQRSDL